MATIGEEAYWGMRPNQLYLSKAFPEYRDDPRSRTLRYATKVIDSDVMDVCDVEVQELVIRQTPGGRQQIKALFFEDDRSIQRLVIQRFFQTSGDKPSRKQHFSFVGEEIDRLLSMVEAVKRAELDDSGKVRFSDEHLGELLNDDDDLLRFLQRHRERLGQLDTVGEFALYLEFCERKRQVELFEALLHDEDRFAEMAQVWGCRGPEVVWQRFFEHNPWIFGLSLSPVFLSSLDGEKLERVVRGYSVAGDGKRADALMRTNGILSSLCFVEIKTHQTRLLHANAYRAGAWSVSNEVAGAVAQCHATVQAAMREFQTRLATIDGDGNPTGNEIFLYQPRSYLIVGCLDEFMTDHGPNESKFRSFELFRRNLRTPEVVTFDELLERAKATVDCSPSMVR